MKLSKLMQGVDVIGKGVMEDFEIKGFSANSKFVKKGYAFFAIKGTQHNGIDYVDEAISRGAVAVVTDSALRLKNKNSCVIKVKNVRETYALWASNFYNCPSENLKIVLVTGTNGKTTVAYLMNELSKKLQRRSAYMGTLGAGENFEEKNVNLTTPDSKDFQRLLKEFLETGVEYIFAEASSHSLDQKRIWGTQIDGALFTNISRDHLDYHRSMRRYFEAKLKLFSELLSESNKKNKFAVINIDDPGGREIKESIFSVDVITVSTKNKGDVRGKILSVSSDYMICELKTPWGEKKVKTKLIGAHNLYNLMLAISSLSMLGMDFYEASEIVKEISPPPGRLQKVWSNPHIFVDYAHTPDALLNVIKELKKIKKGKLIVLFGCGGDRDKGKRKEMGRIAFENSDLAVVTSDNPRTEEPLSIIQDILRGIPRKFHGNTEKLVVEVDRRRAIKKAVEAMKKEDILLVAGKGHENYQIIGNRKIHFDDREEVLNAVKGGK